MLGAGPETTDETPDDAGLGDEARGTDGALGADAANDDADIDIDGSVIVLPPVDGGTDGPTGLPGFCESQTTPFFACWDFDDVEPGGDTGFDGTTNAGGSIDVALEGTNHVLQATLPTAAASRTAHVRRNITSAGALAARYELSFLFGVRQSTLAYVALGALWATTDDTAHVVGAATYAKGKFIDMLLPDMSAPRLAAMPGTTWHAATVTLVPQGATILSTVQVDGVSVEDQKRNVGPASGTNVDVRLGTYFTGLDNGGVTVVFDDIIVRTQ